MKDSSWSDDRVEQLKSLWGTGLSASEIAARIGGWPASSPDNGRNAVIGKARRLGLSRNGSTPPAKPIQPSKPPKEKMVTVRRPPATQATEASTAAETKPSEPSAAPQASSLTVRARRNWGPPTGWVSSAEKLERGFGEPGSSIVGETAEEKYLYNALYK